MSNRPDLTLVACTAFVLMSGAVPGTAGTARAQTMLQKPIAYPARGQSVYQQNNDDGACYGWARQQTGIDPYRVASTPAPVILPGGERVRGAAGGAAAGAVVGAIGGDAGKGAAAGAAVGTIAGGVAHRQQRRQAVAASAQMQASNDWAMTSYWQAWRACMAGRGYSVQ
ncbi:Glycine-zipper containing OmpA-like membrane domain-containing protein [Cupriavidus sp. YR651]|uniref:YMGG-like glycine zipper-containing protein n=1 Tax=Cupriavidus sp. YR651 TaxID=1855315 RepID=UPI00087F1BCE|nr:Glycine-zipper containing OmpA-like membrane domain-containing protein [Cupriavidus sp. YR651]